MVIPNEAFGQVLSLEEEIEVVLWMTETLSDANFKLLHILTHKLLTDSEREWHENQMRLTRNALVFLRK